MDDAFAQLQLPRRPWLEEQEVRGACQRAAAQAHPDASGKARSEEAFTALSKAYQLLRAPASRVRHLIDLELPGTPAPAPMPADVMELFPLMARVREKVDRWNQRHAKGGSALERAVLSAELAQIRRECEAGRDRVSASMERAIQHLQEADRLWPSPASREALPPLQARLSFLEKWLTQLREALLRLDIGPA
jgi:curved DNA-binding protein CbpA